MGLYKRGRYWWFSYTINGKRYRESTKSTNKELALKIYQKKLNQIILQQHNIILEKIKFFKLIDEYIEVIKVYKKSYKRDLLSIKHLKSFIKDIPLKEITPKLIEEYIIKRKKDNVTNATINRELACLRHILNKAIAWNYLDTNPFKKIKLLKEDNQRLRILTKEELNRLIENARSPVKEMIILAVNTGMRRGEILNLKWSEVSLGNRMIYLYNTKSKKRREIPINDVVYNVLLKLKEQDSKGYVFKGKKGKITDIRKSFYTACRKAGITDFKFHDLRHQFASYLAMSGVDLTTIQELLGHSSIQMTMRYKHLLDSHKREAVERLSFCANQCVKIVSGSRQNGVKSG